MNRSLSSKSRFFRNIIYLTYLLVVVFVSLEIILRIYYPFPVRIRGDRFELSTNQTYTFHNNGRSPRLDSIIIHKRNSIGFRGADPGPDIASRLSILTIGGSTTECTYLNEGRTWADLLGRRLAAQYPQVWINNAGLDGHSTFGNLDLLHYYIPTLSFRPKIALFLLGFNDVDRGDLSGCDPGYNNNPAFRIKKWAKRYLETVNLLSDLKNSLSPPPLFSPLAVPDNAPSPPAQQRMDSTQLDSTMKHLAQLLPAYKQRLIGLIDICRKEGIHPVFITQPLIVNGDSPPSEWRLAWLKLQPYNRTTKEVALEQGIPCIDLAQEMPAESALYYDILHYTNKGAEKVSEIVYRGLRPWIDTTFPGFNSKTYH